jgi:DNA-directed RNA polymerase II subunit RPB2
LYCDGGRLFRPLLRVTDNELSLTKDMIDEIELESNNKTKLMKWNNFLQKYPNVIEYVDVEESDGLMIAMYTRDIDKMKSLMDLPPSNYPEDTKINRYDNSIFVRYTHCEIHPSLMLGVVASSIPYCNHNQSPRNIYQYSQARQAMGIYNSSYRYRLDISYVLHHPQTPLVTTRSAKYLHTDKLAAGENVIVAICTYSGYNQEDSIILNQSAIDRGLFRAVSFKKYQETIAKNPSTSQDDVFTKPDRNKVVGTKSGSYDKLNDKGYVPEETQVVNGDIIIGKISPIQPTGNNNKVYKDSSVA